MTKQGNPVTWTTCRQQPTREADDISKSPPKSASGPHGLFLSRLTGSDAADEEDEEAGDAGDDGGC